MRRSGVSGDAVAGAVGGLAAFAGSALAQTSHGTRLPGAPFRPVAAVSPVTPRGSLPAGDTRLLPLPRGPATSRCLPGSSKRSVGCAVPCGT